jgi:hypothetical protein
MSPERGTKEYSAKEYSAFVADAYLSDFIANGGAAVKFVAWPDRDAMEELRDDLRARCKNLGFTFASVDSAQTKMSLIQQVFFSLAAQIDWKDLARKVDVSLAAELHYLPDGGPLTVSAIAERNEVDQNMVRRDMRRSLTKKVIKNYSLAKDFRVAMAHLCLAEMEEGALGQQSGASILDWLRGELKLISALKEMQIYQRIGRHNARVMLTSTARWLRFTGQNGLLVFLDLRGMAPSRRGDVAEGELYYTRNALLDAYEVLRQFIDATDEMEDLMVVVAAPNTMLDEFSNRSMFQYRALSNRIRDDVHDRSRANPYAPLVRLAPSNGGES